MSSCPNISKNIKVSTYSPSKTVAQLVLQLKNAKQPQKQHKNFQTQLDVEKIRSEMKKKWKDPGYANIQFNRPPILRAKLLNQWQFQRIYQAQRSYKYPKGYKGIKFDTHSRKFEQPNRQMLPQKFNKYLDKVKNEYEQKLFMPDLKMSIKKQRITRMLTQNAIKSSTNRNFQKSQYFGFSVKKKIKTISNQ